MVRERTKELSEAPIIRAAFFWPGAHVLILTALHRDGRHHLAEFPEEIEEGIRRPVVPAAGLHLYVIDGVRISRAPPCRRSILIPRRQLIIVNIDHGSRRTFFTLLLYHLVAAQGKIYPLLAFIIVEPHGLPFNSTFLIRDI